MSMSLIRWSPLLGNSMFDGMDQAFDSMMVPAQRGFVPALDVYQTADDVVVETTLPGMNPKDVSVSIENDVLTIEGSSEKKTEVDEKDYYRKEIRSGSFHRAIALPSSVKGDDAKASYENGVLKIVIPKREEIKPKKISIDIK
ncbi:MAG: hypothetical protein A3H59_00025 [Candidatus Jacksonbacteria bacterium RIFCSPLOWO2_02_FULL_43_9]|nr:MAG: hypothetical protein A3B94_03760 [Candidatus Jacksonbacteria bacterium RIFCSPHIGHO2_02_FULL_43_10]OGY70251.1 MAG: hypothetical protein A2986_04270 [Candidatus Jacksonbacteria bacterium RIFCSPLOWO2_01_FULL_44_13]OGY72533.1 MAG: hypothetical protein A3H59_00025 [Candidatus Jacksonbacteria bacterium RIFCSPLOWO2_02_FULL_43_9]